MKLAPLHTLDPRDAAFTVSEHITFGAGNPFTRTRQWQFDGQPDQGGSQECLAFGTAAIVATQPFSQPFPNPDALYAAMCKIDGRQHDPDTGSTLQAAMSVAQARGYFGSFLWCGNATEAWQFIAEHGPVGFALPWFQEMMQTDDEGYVVLPTKLDLSMALGGHFIMFNGTESATGEPAEADFCGVNWSPMFGFTGRFRFRFYDVNTMLSTFPHASALVAPTKRVFAAK